MNTKIWLSPPHLAGNEIEFIQDAFQKNWITSIGENIDVFEKLLEDYLSEEKHISLFNSCTSAIHLALILLGIKNDDEVISQTMTFCGSTNSIAYG